MACVKAEELPVKRRKQFSTLEEYLSASEHPFGSLEQAQFLDSLDPLAGYRDKFHYPKNGTLPHVDLDLVSANEDSIYLCGNSLGLLPRSTEPLLQQELHKWADMGVFGHLQGDLPWAFCDECLEEDMAKLVGGHEGEVALMNGLTVNLHLLMISFYQPTPTRNKILIESRAFPSDHYLVESQIRLHGYDPANCLLALEPRKGEECLQTEDILATLQQHGSEIAVVLLPGVQYYTGQVFDICTLTAEAHRQGCIAGWDLAHAVGNVELQLHDWDVDFAAWCTYKYLNSGAGGLAGAFLHARHADSERLRLQGWWSHKFSSRFNMDNKMEQETGIRGYRISNPPGLLAASLKASLQIFTSASMPALRRKSQMLTGYLEKLLKLHFSFAEDQSQSGKGSQPSIQLLTPEHARGAQLSIAFSCSLHEVFQQLLKRGVACDKRLPHVLRVAPCPLYNSFRDVWRFVSALEESLAFVFCDVKSGMLEEYNENGSEERNCDERDVDKKSGEL